MHTSARTSSASTGLVFLSALFVVACSNTADTGATTNGSYASDDYSSVSEDYGQTSSIGDMTGTGSPESSSYYSTY